MRKIVCLLIIIILSTSVSAQVSDWLVPNTKEDLRPLNLSWKVTTGTNTSYMESIFTAAGNTSFIQNSLGQGGNLYVQNNINAQKLCDENGANCIDISAGISGGGDSDWIVGVSSLYPFDFSKPIGIGTDTPSEMFTVFGGNISIERDGGTNKGGYLHIQQGITAQQICDENNANCKDISSGWLNSSSLDAPDKNPLNAFYVDNTGDSFAKGNLTSLGNICDSSGCIGDSSGKWLLNSADIYFNTGSVGIGTNSPDAKLEIRQSVASIVDMLILGSTTSTPNQGSAILFDTGASQARLQYIHQGTNQGDIEFMTPNGAAGSTLNALTIKSNGRIGVGTDIPSQELDVVGDIEVTGDIIASEANITSDINFGGGARIITTTEDVIIRLP